jgi:hypothetical protein
VQRRPESIERLLGELRGKRDDPCVHEALVLAERELRLIGDSGDQM